MNTKFRNSEEIRKAFQGIFAFNSYEEEIEHKTTMIMYRVLGEVEVLTEEKRMTRKELAQKIGTSASYLTQLYRGNKILNLTTIAKFEKVFNVTFEIKAIPNVQTELPKSTGKINEPSGSIKLNRNFSKKNIPAQKQLVQEPVKKYRENKKDK